MASLDPGWDWRSSAVIARNWSRLDPVHALSQMKRRLVQFSREDFTTSWQFRETQALLNRGKDQGRLLR